MEVLKKMERAASVSIALQRKLIANDLTRTTLMRSLTACYDTAKWTMI